MRLLRPYQENDKPFLTEMLRAEGIPFLEMAFEEYPTMVLENDKKIIGFFTLKKTHNFPMLQHFCVGIKYRSPKNARFLIKGFKKVVQELGFKKVILHAKTKSLKKFISYYFKARAYAFTDNEAWFLVKIQGDKTCLGVKSRHPSLPKRKQNLIN